MKLIDMQVKDYFQLVASDAPAPGGGSASALCGAQGIGLIAMVARLTASKEKFAAYHPVCRQVVETADAICDKLSQQVDIDTEAYGRIAGAFKLPKDTDEQKAARKKAIGEATEYATRVPLETMRLGVQGLECAGQLMGNYNTNCASDVGCGVEGMLCCVRGAWLNVLINVGGVPDQATGDSLKAEGEALAARAEELAAKLAAQVKENI